MRRVLNFLQKEPYTDPVKNPDGEFEVDNWLISRFVLEVLVPVVGIHPFPLNELMLMTSSVCRFKPDLIFDWGTHIGKSPRIFYEVTAAFNIPAQVHSVDLPDDAEHGEHPGSERGKLVRKLKNVTLHQGDGVTKAIEVYKKARKDSKALFFIDGDHGYESVAKELKVILENVKQPIILLHDAFYQTAESKYNIGPFKAIEDVLKKNKLVCQRIDTKTGLPGMTLLFEFKRK